MQFSVTIEEIREGGLDLERELPREFLDAALADGGPGFRAVGPGHFSGHFDKLPGRVLMRAHLDVAVVAPCKRCLAEVQRLQPIDVKMTWVRERPAEPAAVDPAEGDASGARPRGRRRRPDADPFDAKAGRYDASPAPAPDDDDGERAKGSFSDGDLELEPFDGKTVPLDPMLREQILLSLPMDLLCKDDCKGLCPVCGQDLNAAECGHDRRSVDPRWSALKNLELPN